MAYVAPNLTEDELKKQQEGQANPQASVSTGGGQLLGSAGSGGQSAESQPAKPSSSGSWTNLKSYLNAKQDQALGLSDKVAGNIEKQGQEAKGLIDSTVQDYKSELSKNSPNVSQLLSSVNENPVEFSKNPENVSMFSNLRQGIFGGPSSFETYKNYGDVVAKAKNAEDFAQGAKSTGGQRSLIQSLNPSMTSGQTDLNQLLLFGNQGAKQQFEERVKPFQNIQSYLGDQTQAANNEAREQAVENAKGAKKQIEEQFVIPQTKNLLDTQNEINQRYQTMTAEEAQKNQTIQDLKRTVSGESGVLDPQEEQLFFPGGQPSKLSSERLYQYLLTNPTSLAINNPAYANNARNYLLNQPNTIQDQQKGWLDKRKSELFALNSDPALSYLQQNPSEDWLSTYFPGTEEGVGSLSPIGITDKDQAARIVALQNLLGIQNQYFNPDDLEQAGTYKPAKIGQFKGF